MHLHFGDLFVLSNAGFVHALMLVVLRLDVRGLILGMVAQALVYIRSVLLYCAQVACDLVCIYLFRCFF